MGFFRAALYMFSSIFFFIHGLCSFCSLESAQISLILPVCLYIYLFYFCVRVGGVRTISNRRILHMELTITNDNELKINYRWFYITLWIVVFVTRNCRFDMSI